MYKRQGVDGASVMLAHGYDYGRRWDNEDLSENRYLALNISSLEVFSISTSSL